MFLKRLSRFGRADSEALFGSSRVALVAALPRVDALLPFEPCFDGGAVC